MKKCIKDTTAHYIEQRIAQGGTSSDRLPFSRSQIQQLCVATSGQVTQISELSSTPQPSRLVTSLSPHRSTALVQLPTVTMSHVLVDTSVSSTLTTPVQETTVSDIQTSTSVSSTLTTPMQETTVFAIQTSPSIMTVSTTQSSQMTITEPTTVVFGPALPPTMSTFDREREKAKLLKELNTLNIIMQILSGLSG